jgi:tetratricopeptide (TPR) repeat protein
LLPYDKFFDSLRLAHPDTVFTNKDIVSRYAALKLPLRYQPGDNATYDNVNYIFLSLIIESITGLSYPDYIKKNVFEPAGMAKTFFPKATFYHYLPEEKENLVETYNYPFVYSTSMQKTDTIKFIADYWQNYQFKGFGEIITTTEDLLKYDQALYNGQLLSDATLAKAYTLTKLNNGKDSPVEIGLGWKVYNDNPFGQVVGHTGGLVGLSAVFLRNVTKHQTVILFDNTQNRTEDAGEDALKILNGGKATPLAKSAARVYGRIIISKGIDAANAELAIMQKDSTQYAVVENEFNILGYDLKANNKLTLALEAFRKNMQLFPQSWNVYDSYGEALLENGQKDEAIKMYKKSIELNPENDNGIKVLKELSKE